MRYPHLYLIGLTGNIGCGKSTVARLLAARGAAICDADQVTRVVMRPGEPAYNAIVGDFGPEALQAPDGPLNRAALGRIVFADPAALRRLEAIVHPATRTAIEQWLGEQERQAAVPKGCPRPTTNDQRPTTEVRPERSVAVVDAIKLIENGWPAICDAVWVVTCDPAEQLRRLVELRKLPRADAEQRIVAQPSQALKVAAADVVIDNSGSLEAVEAQVERAWQRMTNDQRPTTNDE